MTIKKYLIARNLFRAAVDGLIWCESFLYRSEQHEKKRVLILRKDGLGDCIIFYPTLRAYRDCYKDAEITLVFPDPFQSLSQLLSKDLVDRVIWFNHKKFGSSFLYRRRFMLGLKKAGYNIFIYPVFSRETVGYFMMKMTRAAETIGFDGELSEHGKRLETAGALNYTKLVLPPDNIRLELDRDIYFAEQITGRKISVSFPTIDIDKLPREKANWLMTEYGLTGKKYAVVFPGAGAPYRIWQKENWATMTDYLVSRGIIPVICGSEKEVGLAQDIISLTKIDAPAGLDSIKAIDLSGKTDLPTIAHILANAELYFGSDTGILHLAVAVGCPAVAIVGMGGLNRFFPYGNPDTNKAVFDKTKNWKTGDWNDTYLLKPGEIHPSIANIKIEDAKKEIDSVLEYLSS